MTNTKVFCTVIQSYPENPKVFSIIYKFTMDDVSGQTKEQRELLDAIAKKGYEVISFSDVPDEEAEMRNVYIVERTSEISENEAVVKAIAEIQSEKC